MKEATTVKRTLSAALALLMLGGAFSACGETTGSATDASPVSAEPLTEDAAETEPRETDLLDALPEGDFGGRDYTILLRTGKEYEFFSGELTGEIINDAVYERNTTVEDRWNVRIGYVDRATTWGSGDRFNPELNAMILAGDSDFDIVAGYAAMILGAVEKGLFLNWYDIPHIDVNERWWSAQIADSLTINGKMFAMTGDIALSLWENMVCMYFNRQMAENYGTGDLYGTVLEGNWTFDRLRAAVQGVTEDLNGDGRITVDDRFGYVSFWSTAVDSYLPAFDIQIVKRGEDGWLTYTMNSERMIGALEKMQSLFFDGTQSAVMYSSGDLQKVFAEDRALFFAHDLRTSATLRDMESDYGIVPYPKYDDAQEKYYSTSTDIFSVMLFPSTVSDLEFAGCVTEALCALSWQKVIPAYYEIALKDKYNRDSQTGAMLDIIRDSLIFDVGYLNSFALSTAGHLFVQLAREGRTDFASAYAKNEKVYLKKLAKMQEAYGD